MMAELTLIERLAIWALPVIFAITVHEVAHGWIAERLGDPTARRLGRITLNPAKHIDPIGTLLVPGFLLLAGGFIFGWAKPVPITYENLRRPKRDMALVAVAGPGVNLLMAVMWGILIKLAYGMGLAPGLTQGLVLMGIAGIQINVILMVLNLLPLPPLDGSRVLAGFLSGPAEARLFQLEPYGFVILLGLLVTGILSALLLPPVSAIITAIATVLGI
jgi:Zn-dependent protease